MAQFTIQTFPGSSVLTSPQMNAVSSNFASLMMQENSVPPLGGTWSFAAASILDAPGSHHFGTLKVDSAVLIQGAALIGVGAGVNSGGSFFASSGFNGPQANSYGSVNATSGFQAPATTQSSLGNLNVGCLTVVNIGYPVKAWAAISLPGSAMQGANLVSSKTTITSGNYCLTFSTPMASSLYAVTVTPLGGSAFLTVGLSWEIRSPGTTAFYVQFEKSGAGGQTDPDSGFSVMVMGN
jgi:hypothetical protein